MRITIVYDNYVYKEGLTADWGFSCLVEAHGRKILFDTGAKGGILFDNMSRLDINPVDISDIFISHYHWDHTGGLPDILNTGPKKIYLPLSCEGPQGGHEVFRIDKHKAICEGIYTTGELEGIEQSMIVEAGNGLVVIAGCSHPGVGAILEAASLYGNPRVLVGGLHGFNKFDLLSGLDTVCPTHCTQHRDSIKNMFPGKYIEGGAGKIICIT